MQETAANVRDWQRQPALMDLQQTAWFLGVGYRTVLKLAHTPDFPALKLGKKWLVQRDLLKAWLERRVRRG